jgi:hypothetical protein
MKFENSKYKDVRLKVSIAFVTGLRVKAMGVDTFKPRV